jgi:signal transduction histidine kinase/CheY-like chemotaxis protein
MKIRGYFKKSLSRKYASLMGMSIGVFLVGAAILWMSLYYFKVNYSNQIELLEKKEDLAQDINAHFNDAFSDARGYFAFGNPELKRNALSQGGEMQALLHDFSIMADTNEDKRFLLDSEQFTSYYFVETLPIAIDNYEKGELHEVVKLANRDTTAKIKRFQADSSKYINDVGKKLEDSFKLLIRLQTYVQVAFMIFILIILLTILRITRIMFLKVGQPLGQLAMAANDMANGKEVPMEGLDNTREDEIGALSSSFRKMVETVQEKEQALLSQNQALLEKQNELEDTLHLLKTNGRLNQDILNTIQEGIQLIDVNGDIVQVNKQFQEMFHWNQSQESIVGLKWEEWTSNMTKEVIDAELLFEFLRNAIKTTNNESFVQDNFIYKQSNLHKVIKVYCEGLYYGTKKVGTVLVHRDITKEYEVDQMKSEFVSTVSHELRTPLASILGFTELMINRELKTERQQKYLNTIYHETKRLTALINDFLDVQRMESGKQTYEKKFLDLMPILKKVVEVQQINTDKHHFHLINNVENGLILGDRDKMEQVFTNIINNAVKYSPNGGDIHIRLYHQNDRILVDIKDEGLGIPNGSLKMLFSKFFRIDNSDRRRIGGTGLGLAIVQEIMKAHNGEVTVHSEYGKGSTFTCSFPLVPVQFEPVTNASAQVGYKVLVVEDDQTLGQLISQELKESGFQVSYFKRGAEALNSLKVELPDAIVLDILLEEDEIDGWGIMEKLKNDDALKNIPIFVSTALDEKEKGYSLGATDFLVKPYKPSQLSMTIMQTLLKIGKIGQVYIPETDVTDGEERLRNRNRNRLYPY